MKKTGNISQRPPNAVRRSRARISEGRKKTVQKLENKSREIETEQENEQRRTSDNIKVFRKLERKFKESLYANDDYKKNLLLIQDGLDELASKAKS